MRERLSLLLLLGGLATSMFFGGAPAWGADQPALKDTLGKVQSGAESKAVEDLIEKLKGGTRKAPPPSPAATPAPPAPVATPASPSAQPERPAAEAAPVAPSGKSAAPAADAHPPTPAIKPDDAVKRAELNQAPSIDLEIFFAYKSAEITPQAAAALAPLGQALSDPRLAGDAFLIAGHTDAKGSAEYNLALSQKRAEAVRQHLITNFRLDGAKLVAKGMGSQRLKISDQPLAAANRRVQIVNLSKDQQR
jgi:outer membrane protein OmpA-like peptidoglycan-associated protein